VSERLAAGTFFFAVVALPVAALTWWLVGRRAGVVALGIVAALTSSQMALPARPPLVVGGNWPVPLAPGQIARHRLVVPAQPGPGDPYLYLCTLDALQRDDLEVEIDGIHVGALGPAQHAADFGAEFRWYRIALSRDRLQPGQRTEISVGYPGSRALGGPLRLCTSYSYRPTAGEDASALFDGRDWTAGRSLGALVLRGASLPRTDLPWRYLIELRYLDAAGRPTGDIVY